jgi:hypothetical protein
MSVAIGNQSVLEESNRFGNQIVIFAAEDLLRSPSSRLIVAHLKNLSANGEEIHPSAGDKVISNY